MKYLIVLIFISFILSDNINNEEYNEPNGYDESNYNDSSISSENNEDNNLIDASEYEAEEETPDGIYQIKTLDQFTLNIKKNGTEGNTLVILFHSYSCPHCIEFMPKYRSILEELQNNSITNIKLSKVEASYNEKILKKYNQIVVNYFPVIYIYKNGNFILYSGGMTKKDVMSFIDRLNNFKCNKISTFDELNKFINYQTIYSLDKKSQFILGIFKNNTSPDNNKFVIDNFININSLNSLVINKDDCYFFFVDRESLLKIKKNDSFVYNIINNGNNENNDNNNNYLIYTYNYQKGLNTFSLFKSYLNMINNTKIKATPSVNNYKNIKIMERKYRSFINKNYLYKYYDFNEENKKIIYQQNKKLFIFLFSNEKVHKLFINTINKIVNFNSDLYDKYLFVLFSNIKYKAEEEIGVDMENGVILFDLQTLDNINVTEPNDELNNTYLELQIFNTIQFLDEIKNKDDNKVEGNNIIFSNTSFNFSDEDEELIKEINKTIIEDNLKQKNIESKDKKVYYKTINNLNSNDDYDLDSNKRIIMIPLCLIIYSVLYYYFYKYILDKYSEKSIYNKLPLNDPKLR